MPEYRNDFNPTLNKDSDSSGSESTDTPINSQQSSVNTPTGSTDDNDILKLLKFIEKHDRLLNENETLKQREFNLNEEIAHLKTDNEKLRGKIQQFNELLSGKAD